MCVTSVNASLKCIPFHMIPLRQIQEHNQGSSKHRPCGEVSPVQSLFILCCVHMSYLTQTPRRTTKSWDTCSTRPIPFWQSTASLCLSLPLCTVMLKVPDTNHFHGIKAENPMLFWELSLKEMILPMCTVSSWGKRTLD